jgi:tight adherence protein B
VIAALLIGGCTFGAVLLASRAPKHGWALERVQPYLPASAGQPAAAPAARASSTARLAMASLLERLHLTDKLRIELERAGSAAAPEALAWGSLIAGLGAGLLAAGLAGSAVVALVAALAAAAGPHVVLAIRIRRRVRAFDVQLPDILDLLAASLKVGHSFDQALRAVADDAGEPAGSEFRRALGEIRLGRPSDEALAAVGTRLASDDLPFVLTAVEIQQQVGGSLAGLLTIVSGTVRERQNFRRKIKALTAMGRASAASLIALPFVAAGALSLVRPGYMQPLWQTGTGEALTVGALVSMGIGTLILRRIVAVKV